MIEITLVLLGIIIPYLAIFYQVFAKEMTLKQASVTQKKASNKTLLKRFVINLKKNTLALKALKSTIESKHVRDSSNRDVNYEKIIDISNSVNEKLEVVHKLRTDIKIYKTINTILTNYYIKETRNHENTIDSKIMKLEKQIIKSYDDLKDEVSKMADNISVAKENNFVKNSSSIENSNVFVVGNDIKCNQYNQLFMRNEIYNHIIKKIDKIFCGLVSFLLVYPIGMKT